MKVKVSEIPEEGLEIEERASLKINEESVPAFIRLRLQKKDAEVLAEGTIRAQVELTCARCLNRFTRGMDVEVNAVYHPAEELTEESHELVAEELETGFYRGDELDLDALAAEQLILNLPMRVLCDEACRGMCPRCGADLNRETCKCLPEEGPGESRLSDIFKIPKERSK